LEAEVLMLSDDEHDVPEEKNADKIQCVVTDEADEGDWLERRQAEDPEQEGEEEEEEES
jgi:hypothetical protein